MILVIATILIFAMIFILSQRRTVSEYTIYLKDNELYLSLLEGEKPIRLTEEFGTMEDAMGAYHLTQLIDGGRTVVYPDLYLPWDGSYSLYCRSTSNAKDEPKLIDSGILFSQISKNEKRVIYVKEDGLYLSNFRKTKKITEDVKDCWISDDGKQVLFTNSKNDLFLSKGSKDAERIEKNVTISYVSEDFSEIYFEKEDELYRKKDLKEKKKIASNIKRIVKVYEDGSVYFLQKEERQSSLMDYIDDDLISSDQSMEMPAFPQADDFQWPKAPNEADYDGWKEYNIAYSAYSAEYDRVHEQYNAALAAYYDAENLWKEIETRNQLREDLKNWKVDLETYGLCYYNGEEVVEVSKGLDASNEDHSYSVSSEEKSPVIAFNIVDESKLEKVKISEIDDIKNVEAMVKEKVALAISPMVAVREQVSKLEATNVMRFEVSEDAKTVLFIGDVIEGNSGNLYTVSIAENQIGKPEKYDENVYVGYLSYQGEDEIYYGKEFNEETYQFEFYHKKEMVDRDVFVPTIKVTDENNSFYMKNVDTKQFTGSLYYYTKGSEVKKISDQALNVFAEMNENVLYFVDFNQSSYSGNLYSSKNGKEGELLDKDVQFIVSPQLLESDK